ncbi:MAG TPA: hypothetical protein VLA77_00185 [Candidatus Saccharimonadales bacterium]|nr:hypothetical protein [Candidatus Saccharimonadales bacterium]
MIKRAELLAIVKDRLMLGLIGLVVMMALITVLVTLIRLNASDVQIPIRYTDYGTANIYRNQWFALYIFPIFALVVAGVNAFIATKIYSLDRLIALSLLGITTFILVVGLIVTNSILNLAPSV